MLGLKWDFSIYLSPQIPGNNTSYKDRPHAEIIHMFRIFPSLYANFIKVYLYNFSFASGI